MRVEIIKEPEDAVFKEKFEEFCKKNNNIKEVNVTREDRLYYAFFILEDKKVKKRKSNAKRTDDNGKGDSKNSLRVGDKP